LRIAISSDSKRVFIGDWAGNVKITNAHEREHVGELRSNPPRLDQQLAAAQQVLSERQAVVNATAAKKKAADMEVAEATKKRDAAIAQLAAVEQKLRTLESQDAALRGQLKKLGEQLNTERASIETAKVAINNMENGLKTVTAAVSAVAGQTQSEMVVRDEQARRCQQLETSQKAFAARSAQLVAAVADQAKRLAGIESQRTKIESQLAAIRERTESAGEDVEKTDQQREPWLTKRAEELDAQKEVAQQSLAVARENLEFFQTAYGK